MDPTNRNTALASALVEELARSGVERAAVAPGSRSSPLALALWREPGIEVTVHIDERCAGFWALGAAQATGRPVCVLCTSGTAAANLHPAVAEAGEASVGLVVLTADRPPELRGVGAGQTIDQLKLYGSSVRWFCELGVQEASDEGLLHVRSVACRAFAAAAGDPRPGPVHVNVPLTGPLAPLERPGEVTATSILAREGRGARPLTSVRRQSPGPAAAEIERLTERLEGRRGLIVAGRRPDGGHVEGVTSLAAASGFPILAEPTSQLRLGTHDRSRVLWAYDLIARHAPAALAPEVVVRIGDMPTSKPLRRWLGALQDLDQIVIDETGAWNEPTHRAATLLRADPGASCAALADALDAPSPDRGWHERWRSAEESAALTVASELDGAAEPSEPGAWRALGRLLHEGLLYAASSMPIRDQETFLESGPAAVRFLANRGANGIDGLISSGIGSADASGEPALLVTGDLGLYHDMNGLLALRRTAVPVRIIVLDNDGGGIFHFLPQAASMEPDAFESLLATPSGLDFERVAALYDVPYHRVTDLRDLGPAVASPGHALIHVPVDRHANLAVHERIESAVGSALASLAEPPPTR